MPLNYAATYKNKVLEIFNQGCLTSPFITSNVEWLGARSFHFTQLATSGFKNHTRNGGFNAGSIEQRDNVFSVNHDRDVEFFVDKADVDETNSTASLENINTVFNKTQVVPEIDAYFFAKVAQRALIDINLKSSTARSSYTVANVFTKLKEILKRGRIRADRANSVLYIDSDIMDLLERSTELTKKVELTQIAEGGLGIETRVTYIDGVPVIEVIDNERFYTAFDYAEGFEALKSVYEKKTLSSGDSLVGLYAINDGAWEKQTSGTYSSGDYYEKKSAGAFKINALVANTQTCVTVPKINSLYFFGPGEHTKGDGYLYQNRSLLDTFVFPNGKNNKVDSIAVDIDTAEVEMDIPE